MPVKEEYEKGPVVILRIEKQPGHPWDIPFAHDWLKVDLFSDERRLSGSGSGPWGSNRIVFGFTFWAEADMSVSPDGAVELERLGELTLKVTVSKTRKVLDLPLRNMPSGKDPFFEDDDVQIWEVQWEEKWSEFGKDDFTCLKVRFNSKTDSASYFLNSSGKDGSRLGASTTESWTEHLKGIPKSQLAEVQFWKTVPLAARTISSLEFLPQ